MTDTKGIPPYLKFLFASMSGIGATIICFPLEVLKTQMQLFGRTGKGSLTTVQLAKHIVKTKGIGGLYAGIQASMLRQAVYLGTRLGAFNILVDYVEQDGSTASFTTKLSCSALAGAAGGAVGLPTDVVLTRVIADGVLPPESRRNYKNPFNAMYRITKEEGFITLFRGFNPVVIRAIIVNLSQLTTYNQSKRALLHSGIVGDNTICHVLSSILAALNSNIFVLPVDLTKTRIQSMKVINGKPEYSSIVDVWVKTIKRDGFFSLWKGFTPSFIRNGPQSIAVFVIFENLTYYYRTLVLKRE